MHASDFPPDDQAAAFEHAQMLRDRRRRDAIRCTQLRDRARPLCQPLDNAAPDRVRQGRENIVKRPAAPRG